MAIQHQAVILISQYGTTRSYPRYYSHNYILLPRPDEKIYSSQKTSCNPSFALAVYPKPRFVLPHPPS